MTWFARQQAAAVGIVVTWAYAAWRHTGDPVTVLAVAAAWSAVLSPWQWSPTTGDGDWDGDGGTVW